MQIVLSGRHTSLTDHEKQAINEKFGKYVKKLNGLTKIEVVVNVEKDRHDVEAIFHMAHQNPLVVHASGSSNLVAVDLAVSKLGNLIEKRNGKLNDTQHGKIGH